MDYDCEGEEQVSNPWRQLKNTPRRFASNFVSLFVKSVRVCQKLDSTTRLKCCIFLWEESQETIQDVHHIQVSKVRYPWHRRSNQACTVIASNGQINAFVQRGNAKVPVRLWSWPVGPHDLRCTKCRKKHAWRGITEVFYDPFNVGKKLWCEVVRRYRSWPRHHRWKLFGCRARSCPWSRRHPNAINSKQPSDHQHCSGYPCAGTGGRLLAICPETFTTGIVHRPKMHGRGEDFVWGKDNNPLIVRPDGQIIEFKMNGRVPQLDDECLPKEIPTYLLDRLPDTIEKIHDHINPCRYALAASDIEGHEALCVQDRGFSSRKCRRLRWPYCCRLPSH